MIPFSFNPIQSRKKPKAPDQGCEVVTFNREPVNVFAADVRQCEAHWHAAAEFICILKGSFAIGVDGNSKTYHSGGMVFLAPNKIHSLQSKTANSRLLTVQFSPLLFQQLTGDVSFNYGVKSFEHQSEKDRSVWDAMLDLASEYVTDLDTISFSHMSLIYRLLANIERVSEVINLTQNSVRDNDDELIKTCLTYIDSHYMEPLTLTDIAERSGLSYHYVSRMFKRVCGFNFKDYLTFIRVSKALPLLCDTTFPITDIAHKCGFSEHKLLIAAFRKYYDQTPTAFRKKYNGGYNDTSSNLDLINVPMATALSSFPLQR
ncbi:transcriptional regulator, AraC family protein [Vibrio mediterranei AK1]|uniref:AraC family transcriptional regulator n=1 Tax=Vibrio mediterranei TaxID=689 RepID=UPI0001540D34|nr:AraC family transcriptional regulator [Vibrio mediterranei]EDL55294.1 transcriptional regulator, AraC family protein [Vibrio mediterranei AK1]